MTRVYEVSCTVQAMQVNRRKGGECGYIFLSHIMIQNAIPPKKSSNEGN